MPLEPAIPEDWPTITVDGLQFRDLDHDGELSPYEDWRRPSIERAVDLLGRMTLAEKAGLMMHGTAPAVGSPFGALGVGPAYDLDAAAELIIGRGVNAMITRLSLPPAILAEQNNALQRVAARGRLGIPVTISTDPRSHFRATTGASVAAAGFSQWPETLGFGAIGDADLVREFADIVRQEYRAVGIHMALSPQADLPTSPRWPRIEGSFSEDPDLTRRLVGAYVEGLQRGVAGVGPDGVAAVVKHWVGYGASRDGFDGHNYYGRFSSFTGGAFEAHVRAFLDAFSARVAGVMPTYNILEGVELDGEPLEAVGAGFNRQLLRGLLRGVHGFEGVVLSDWAITKDCSDSCRTGSPPQGVNEIAMPWGVERLSQVERFAKGVVAGIDQFGGENDPGPLLAAIARGLLSEVDLDASVRRILKQKFDLGLFDRPFVETTQAAAMVGAPIFQGRADAAQRRAVTWLVRPTEAPILEPGARVYAHGFAVDVLTDRGLSAASDPAEADIAIVRIDAPFERLHPGFFFGARQHEGDLDFKDGTEPLELIRRLAATVRTVVVVHLDRPAVLTPLLVPAWALLAEFGASDDAIVDVLSGRSVAEGAPPFDLPRSMAAVLSRHADVPFGDPDPLYSA